MNTQPHVPLWIQKAVDEETFNNQQSMWPNEPSAEYRVLERRQYVKLLRKNSHTNSYSASLALQLESCHRKQRCYSGACPECGRLLQRWLVRSTKRIVRTLGSDHDDLVSLTIIPHDNLIRPSKLRTFSADRAERRLKSALKAAGISHAIGAMDLSFNQHKDGDFRPHWSAHFHLIVPRPSKAAITVLRQRFPNQHPEICRAVRRTKLQNNKIRRSYFFKSHFRKRHSYWNAYGTKFRTSHGRLSAPEKADLLIFLNRVGFEGRMILYGIRPIQSSPDVTLALLKRNKPSWKDGKD